MLQIVYSLLFPKRCVACKKLGSYICVACTGKLKPATPLCVMCDRPAIYGITHPQCKTKFSIDGNSVCYSFAPPMKQVIHELKYRGVTDMVNICAEMVACAIPEQVLAKKPIIIAVPLHESRKRERGFNQSELLAQSLARSLHLEYSGYIISRNRKTPTQTKLNKVARKKNVAEAFSTNQNLTNKSFILVDDTITTGATVVSCANTLKRAGANFVWATTLAQAPLGGKQLFNQV